MIEFWAEAGPCDNSIDEALKYAKMVHEAGASALKVQWYNADTLVTRDAPRYDHTSGTAATQHEMFAKSIYPYHLWEPVISYCRSVSLDFIPSVFDFEAVDTAADYDLPILKIASGDLTYHQLIRYADESAGSRLALSTGAATYDEIKSAIDHVSSLDHLILMACHLAYPTPYHQANIARTYALQTLVPEAIPGFSDHTPGIDTIPLIVASGCQVIEKHVTLKPGQGYDSDFALAPVDVRNAINKIEGTLAVMGYADLVPDAYEESARTGARRSPYAAHHIPAGHVITLEDIAILRPHYGLYPDYAPRLVGRSFETDIPAGGEFPVDWDA